MVLVILGLVAVAMNSGGCEETPVSQTQKNINTFTLAQQKVTQGRRLVGDTLVSLNAYCAQPGLPAYTAFAQHAQATHRVSDELRDIGAVMTDQGTAFFADWDREIAAMTNADLKKHTEARKTSAQAAFGQIAAEVPAARAVYDTFVADLNNLQTFFDYDKTATGVAAASKLVARTRIDGAELERQLDLESANLNQVKATFVAMQRG
jgi:hypothetical protein